jgi:Ca2+-binding EF-hand superfamily protein
MLTKRTLVISAAVAALVVGLGAAAAIAERGGRGFGGHGGGQYGGDRRGGMMGMMQGDLCRDSRPDRAEMRAAFAADGLKWEAVAAKRDACFARFDTNKSGTIEVIEIAAAVELRAKGLANRAVAMVDDDFNGTISREEVAGGWFGGRHGGKHNRRRGGDDTPRDAAADVPTPSDTAAAPDSAGNTDGPDEMDGMMRGGRGAMMTKLFDQADANKDNVVDNAELLALATLLVEDGKRRVLHRLDKDKSGTITRAEFDQPARDRFAMGDLNDNGIIARDELPLPMQWRLAN